MLFTNCIVFNYHPIMKHDQLRQYKQIKFLHSELRNNFYFRLFKNRKDIYHVAHACHPDFSQAGLSVFPARAAKPKPLERKP